MSEHMGAVEGGGTDCLLPCIPARQSRWVCPDWGMDRAHVDGSSWLSWEHSHFFLQLEDQGWKLSQALQSLNDVNTLNNYTVAYFSLDSKRKWICHWLSVPTPVNFNSVISTTFQSLKKYLRSHVFDRISSWTEESPVIGLTEGKNAWLFLPILLSTSMDPDWLAQTKLQYAAGPQRLFRTGFIGRAGVIITWMGNQGGKDTDLLECSFH